MNHTIIGLGLFPLLTIAAVGDAESEYREIIREFDAEFVNFIEESNRLEASGGDADAFRSDWDPAPVFVEIMLEKAEEYAGSDDAVQFLDWIVQYDPMVPDADFPEAATAALRTLVESHVSNEDFLSLVASAPYRVYELGRPRVVAEMSVLAGLAHGTDLEVSARYSRACARMRDGATTPNERALCMADLEFARASMPAGRTAEIEHTIFELQHLQIGQVAPEITSADLDGVEFSLSDYRGKVLMLDFWGDW